MYADVASLILLLPKDMQFVSESRSLLYSLKVLLSGEGTELYTFQHLQSLMKAAHEALIHARIFLFANTKQNEINKQKNKPTSFLWVVET